VHNLPPRWNRSRSQFNRKFNSKFNRENPQHIRWIDICHKGPSDNTKSPKIVPILTFSGLKFVR
jgi:hypothetical protein